VYSERGVSRSAAVVIAYIMDKEGISYYEAYIKVPSMFHFLGTKIFFKAHERRYCIQPNRGFARQLSHWGEKRKAKRNLSIGKQEFQCLCGASVITLLSPLTPHPTSTFSLPRIDSGPSSPHALTSSSPGQPKVPDVKPCACKVSNSFPSLQHNTTQHNTTQRNITQHNTTQHNTTEHNTTHPNQPAFLICS